MSEPLTSPRIERLRVLYAQLEDLEDRDDRTDADLNYICDEVRAISQEIETAPASGRLGVVERAMAVYYWYRPNGSAYTEGDICDEAVRGLVNAVIGMEEGAPMPLAGQPVAQLAMQGALV